MGAVTGLFYHIRQKQTIFIIFPNVRKTPPQKRKHTARNSEIKVPLGGFRGDTFKKRACSFPLFTRPAEKPRAVNNYLLNRLLVDGAGLFC